MYDEMGIANKEWCLCITLIWHFFLRIKVYFSTCWIAGKDIEHNVGNRLWIGFGLSFCV